LLSFTALRRARPSVEGLLLATINETTPTRALNQYSPIDLALRRGEMRAWFAGTPVYASRDATYPPASFMILYPLMGHGSFTSCRWAFAGVSALLLALLCALILRESRIEGPWRWVACLVVLGGNATWTTVCLGQMAFVSMALGLTGGLIAARGRRVHAVLGGALAGCALIKPAIGLPLLCLLAISPYWWMALAAAGSTYGALTAAAYTLRPSATPMDLLGWTANAAYWTRKGGGSYGTLQSCIPSSGAAAALIPFVSVLTLACLAVFVRRYRSADIWTLVALASVAARLWGFHRGYDDVIALPAFIALPRIARFHPSPRMPSAAAGLCVSLALAHVAPYHLPFGRALLAANWVGALVLLGWAAVTAPTTAVATNPVRAV
jgi:hypothetical protein